MKDKHSLGRQIAIIIMILIICLLSQLFKNISMFITGPIINMCHILMTVLVNLPCAILLGTITPITAYFLAPNPLMKAVPWVILLIILGNNIFIILVNFLMKKDLIKYQETFKAKSYLNAILCSIIKGIFMGLTISLLLLPTFITTQHPLYDKLNIFQINFSLNQSIATMIGFIYYFIITTIVKYCRKHK